MPLIALTIGALVCLAAAHQWDNPAPGTGDDDATTFDSTCPLGNFDPADKQTVCAIVVPSTNFVKDFVNAAELVRYNCLQPNAPYFLVANTTCLVFYGGT